MSSHERTRQILTSIDIGTTKICVIVAQVLSDNQLIVKGIGKAISEGLKKGVVVDIGKTIYAISTAVAEAEIMAEMSIESAIIGISGGHISSLNSLGIVPIKKGIVKMKDIENALAAAQAVLIPEGQQILHVLPKYFVIDGRDTVYDPVGMYGVRLEVEAHIITGAVSSVQNLISCCQQANILVSDIVLEQLASAQAVLSVDERMLGVAVLDIGGGTSDLALYHQDSICHTMVLPVAGNHFTNDLAIGLRTMRAEAERIKKEFGIVHDSFLNIEKVIEIEQVQGNDRQVVLHRQIYEILRPRAVELFQLIKKEIHSNKLQGYMATGLVLTGGGSLLKGMQELAEEIFEIPVRIGKPHISFDLPETLQSPIYSTGYGMILHAIQKNRHNRQDRSQTQLSPTKIFERMKTWITDLF
jgi:cell division protein FtsA